MEEKVKKVLARMQNLCARREYCEKDIHEKVLKALDGDEKSASEVMESLVADKFVSDLRYSTCFAREKSSLSGWGAIKISFALRQKHIPQEIISEALQGIDKEKAAGRLESVLAAKRKSLQGDPQIRLKLIRFGLSRGYSYDEVMRFVDARSDGPASLR